MSGLGRQHVNAGGTQFDTVHMLLGSAFSHMAVVHGHLCSQDTVLGATSCTFVIPGEAE